MTLDKDKIEMVLSMAQLCTGSFRWEDGWGEVSYCSVGALARYAGVADDDLKNFISFSTNQRERVRWSIDEKLALEYGLTRYQIADLMYVNDFQPQPSARLTDRPWLQSIGEYYTSEQALDWPLDRARWFLERLTDESDSVTVRNAREKQKQAQAGAQEAPLSGAPDHAPDAPDEPANVGEGARRGPAFDPEVGVGPYTPLSPRAADGGCLAHATVG